MKKIINLLSILTASCLYGNEPMIDPKDHEIWWQQALGSNTSFESFAGWLGDENASSRILMRRHVFEKNYKSILDVPCGLCIDYYGLKKNGFEIEYLGVDVTPQLVALAIRNSIPATLGSIEYLPVADNTYDLAYARHILEHLSSYEKAFSELIRVAKKEVLVVFFIPPNETLEDRIKLPLIGGYPIYHNSYSRAKLEKHLSNYNKIKYWDWEKVSDQEEILHIYCE